MRILSVSHITVLRLIKKHGLRATFQDGRWDIRSDDLNYFVQGLKRAGATARSIYGPRAKGEQGPWAHTKVRASASAKPKPVRPVVSAVYLGAMAKMLADADG